MAPILATLALSAILPNLNPARIGELAESISAVAETPDDVARLAVTVARESGGSLAYERCDRVGAAGEISGYQIRRFHFSGHTRAEICADPQLAASIALGLLRRRKTMRGNFAAYLGRNLGDGEVSTRVWLYGKALAAMGGGLV